MEPSTTLQYSNTGADPLAENELKVQIKVQLGKFYKFDCLYLQISLGKEQSHIK